MNQQVDPARITWKVSIIGSVGSGKSALIARIVYDTPEYTAQFRSLTKKVLTFELGGRKMKADVLLQEIDPSPSSEKLMLGSSAIMITIDITEDESLVVADEFLKYVTTFEKSPLKFVVATKLDRKYEAKVWDPELNKLSKKYGVRVFKTSSRTGEGVNEILDALSSELSSRVKKVK